MASTRERPSATKHEDESLAKELQIGQGHAGGDLTDVDEKKLKFKIDCWLMPIL